MYQKERIAQIMKILEENSYTTVKFLTEQLHYSTATINRDLNVMEKQKLVERSYGGVELVEKKGVPFPFRYHKRKSAKAKISKAAADLVNDGDTLFIDATTTTQYMAKYLLEKKNITVITNNCAIVSMLSEHGIRVICLGGEVTEAPYLLSGNLTVENAMKYNADKMFFSTYAVSEDGVIDSSPTYDLVHKIMKENSKEVYYLADREKLNKPSSMNLFNFSDVDTVITDFPFSENVQKKYQSTKFIVVK